MDKELNDFLKYLNDQSAIDCMKDGALDLDPDLYPEALITIWEKDGFCGYLEGLWWFTSPKEMAAMSSLWFPHQQHMQIIGRTAFADLFVISERNNISVINTRIREIILDKEDLSFFFNVLLPNPDFLTDILDQQLFNEAVDRLGKLSSTQCYGFFPPLNLGGGASSENLEKVELWEHLVLLHQI